VHGIVQNHGGWLSIESRVGEGARIHVFLPLVGDAISDRPPPAREATVARSGRILLVDDEPALVEVGKEILENLGYEVDTSTNGTLALNLFLIAPQRFDVVITDMTMPGMTGDVLSKEILRLRPDIPIVLCTGYSERINEDVAHDIGIRKLLMKPFKMDDLIKILGEILP
jgi:CheY-like chemotaxis protein